MALGWFLLLACSGCRLPWGARKGDAPVAGLELTPIRTKHRYVTSADLPQPQLRVALVDVILKGEKASTTLTVGMFRPRDGLLKTEAPLKPCPSIQALVAALDPYVDRMPVGLILTINGEIPGKGGEPPPAFGAVASQLQKALEKEEISYAFIVTADLHVLQ